MAILKLLMEKSPLRFLKDYDVITMINEEVPKSKNKLARIFHMGRYKDRLEKGVINSKYPIGSWSAYCVSKAGLDMWTRCLAEEGQEHNISAISVAPGIVDTNMQKNIRYSNPDEFPLHPHFVDYHESGQLVEPDVVAKQLLSLVTTHNIEQTGNRFDVREL